VLAAGSLGMEAGASTLFFVAFFLAFAFFAVFIRDFLRAEVARLTLFVFFDFVLLRFFAMMVLRWFNETPDQCEPLCRNF